VNTPRSASARSASLAMTVLGQKAGVDMLHVPYRGGGPAMNDVLGGHCRSDRGFGGADTPQLEGGKLRAVAAARSRTSVGAEGYADRDRGRLFPISRRWPGGGVFAPKGTPAEVTGKMAREIREVLSEPATTAKRARPR